MTSDTFVIGGADRGPNFPDAPVDFCQQTPTVTLERLPVQPVRPAHQFSPSDTLEVERSSPHILAEYRLL